MQGTKVSLCLAAQLWCMAGVLSWTEVGILIGKLLRQAFHLMGPGELRRG